MAFHDTKKNNGYHSLFIKLFGYVWGGVRFFPDTVYMYYCLKHGPAFPDLVNRSMIDQVLETYLLVRKSCRCMKVAYHIWTCYIIFI